MGKWGTRRQRELAPALLFLSDIGGAPLCNASRLGATHLEAMLLLSLRSLATLMVAHDDHKLDNSQLVGNSIEIIDFRLAFVIERHCDVDKYIRLPA